MSKVVIQKRDLRSDAQGTRLTFEQALDLANEAARDVEARLSHLVGRPVQELEDFLEQELAHRQAV